MRESAKGQVAIIQSSPGINQENSHSDGLLAASLFASLIFIVFAIGVFLVAKAGWKLLNSHESTGPDGTEPTDAAPLT